MEHTTTPRFLEAADLARAEGITPATVRRDIAAGRLKPAAVTVRGARLFLPEDAEAYHRARQARNAGHGEAA